MSKCNQDIGALVKVVSLCAGIILENGGETYRAEETVSRICKAYGCEKSGVFATPTGVFISVSNGDEKPESCIIRIRKRGIDLTVIDLVNSISRQLTSKQMEIDAAIEILQAAVEKKHEKMWHSAVAAGLSSGFFALLFRGNAFDFLAATLCGMVVQFMANSIKAADMFNFTISLLGGFLIGVGSVLCVSIPGLGHLDKIISGAMMPLLPGVPLINAVRDTMRGDLISGVSRIAEVLLISILLAFGAGIVLTFYFKLIHTAIS